RVWLARRPVADLNTKVEVDDEDDDEHRPLDHHEARGAPPDEPLVTEDAPRQHAHVEHAPCIPRLRVSGPHARASPSVGTRGGRDGRPSSACSSVSRSRSRFFGQNHPINVTASGRIAAGTAHGVKIDPMKNADVTTAQRNGQIDGSGYS